MCTYVGNKIALVAKKDITVYKQLHQHNDEWITPYQYSQVQLNKIMYPNEVKELHKESGNKYIIEGGAIHAHVKINKCFKYNACFKFKAIIKAGTTYYVQDDFYDIAAKELYITNEQVLLNNENELVSPDIKEIYNDYLRAVFNNPEYRNDKGICVGFFKLSDGTYANPLSDFDHSKAIGVVGFLHENKPVVVALDSRKLPWLTKNKELPLVRRSSIEKSKLKTNVESCFVNDDMDGKKHTFDICNSIFYDQSQLKAINYCITYNTEGTKKGDWYLGSIGEMMKISQNLGIINAAILTSGIGDEISLGTHWTSSETVSNGNHYIWICYMYDCDCNAFYQYECAYAVRPLYSD